MAAFTTDVLGITAGMKMEFEYNGKDRQGTVEKILAEGRAVCIKHDDPAKYEGKAYSTYVVAKMTRPAQIARFY